MCVSRRALLRLARCPAHIAAMTRTLPILPLRDIVVFPHRIVPLFVGREKSVAALEAAMADDKELFLVAQLDPGEDDPDRDALYDLGVVATAMQLLKLPDGTVRVLVEGVRRARLVDLQARDGYTSWPRSRTLPRRRLDGPRSAGADALGRRPVRQLRQAQQAAAARNRASSSAEIERAVGARRRGRLEPVDQGRRQAGAARRAQPVAPARDGVRLHGGRARRAPGREEDPQPGQAPDGEDPARILSQRAVEGDPARARQ